MTKSYKISADIYIEAETDIKAEEKLKEILQWQASEVDINETVLFEETDDSLCFMCEKRPKQEKNDMCPQCWNEFLARQEAKEKAKAN